MPVSSFINNRQFLLLSQKLFLSSLGMEIFFYEDFFSISYFWDWFFCCCCFFVLGEGLWLLLLLFWGGRLGRGLEFISFFIWKSLRVLQKTQNKKSCYDLYSPQQIRPQTIVQWYIFWCYSMVRIGFNMITKRHTLPALYIMSVKIF